MSRFFWLRDGLAIDDGRLRIAGRDAEALAREHGTPLYVYDLDRVAAKATALRDALDCAGLNPVIRFALKANHHPRCCACCAAWASASTPARRARSNWRLRRGTERGRSASPGRTCPSATSTCWCRRGVHMNLDLLSQLRRYGRRAPGTAVGLRVNPRAGGAYGGGGETLYSGDRPTKFGIYEEGLDEALAIAREHGLTIDTVHMHVGDGFLDDGLRRLRAGGRAGRRRSRAKLIDAGCPIREVNTGGGLGVPQAPGERPLDLDAYAAILARHLGRLDVTVGCEPGDFLVKDSAMLLCEVVTVEDRLGTTFVGLDAGWNVMPDRFIYDVSPDIVLCRAVDAPIAAAVTVAGHINEGDDLFAEEHPMPVVRRGRHRGDDGRRWLPPGDEQHPLPATARAVAVPSASERTACTTTLLPARGATIRALGGARTPGTVPAPCRAPARHYGGPSRVRIWSPTRRRGGRDVESIVRTAQARPSSCDGRPRTASRRGPSDRGEAACGARWPMSASTSAATAGLAEVDAAAHAAPAIRIAASAGGAPQRIDHQVGPAVGEGVAEGRLEIAVVRARTSRVGAELAAALQPRAVAAGGHDARSRPAAAPPAPPPARPCRTLPSTSTRVRLALQPAPVDRRTSRPRRRCRAQRRPRRRRRRAAPTGRPRRRRTARPSSRRPSTSARECRRASDVALDHAAHALTAGDERQIRPVARRSARRRSPGRPG